MEKVSAMTGEDLKKGAKILIYHIRMYIETMLELESRGDPIGWDTVHNSLLESHLMNARVLIEFLVSEKKYPSDITAKDYFDDWASKVSDATKNELKKHLKIIGGRLVHLTTKADFELKSQQKWPTRDLFNELLPVLEKFFHFVPDQKSYEGMNEEASSLIALAKGSEFRLESRAST